LGALFSIIGPFLEGHSFLNFQNSPNYCFFQLKALILGIKGASLNYSLFPILPLLIGGVCKSL